jgi:hypothetical protein
MRVTHRDSTLLWTFAAFAFLAGSIMLTLFINRLARAVDRSRELERHLAAVTEAERVQEVHKSLAILARRGRLLSSAIALATICALLISPPRQAAPPPARRAVGRRDADDGQYLRAKAGAPDALLLFRMGDCRGSGEDAVTASRVLGITLTSRSRARAPSPWPACR